MLRRPPVLGSEALLDFRMDVTIEGKTLSPAKVQGLLAGADIGPGGAADGADPEWSRVVAGVWLSETLSMAIISGSDRSPGFGYRTYSIAPCGVGSVFRGVVSRYTE